MKREFAGDDWMMVYIWILMAITLPLVTAGAPDISTTVARVFFYVGIIMGIFFLVGSTVTYLYYRSRSEKIATRVMDVLVWLLALWSVVGIILRPETVNDMFPLMPMALIIVAARWSYPTTMAMTAAVMVLYGVTAWVRLPAEMSGILLGTSALRFLTLGMVATAISFIAHRGRRMKRDSEILMRVATAISSTLDIDELMHAVVEGISDAAGLGRCSAFLTSGDERWAYPVDITEKDPELRKRFFELKVDLKKDNAATQAMNSRETLVITRAEDNPLLAKSWTSDFRINALMVLPILLHDEATGIVFIERRGLKKYFTEREVEICEVILAQASAALENAMRYADEQKKRSQADILYRASRELGFTLSMEGVLENACRLAMRSTLSSGCVAFMLDVMARELKPKVALSAGGVKTVEFAEGSEVPVVKVEEMYKLSQRPRVLVQEEPAKSPVLPPFLKDAGIALLVPFFTQGRISGMLCVTDSEGRKFSEIQLDQLGAIAGQTALAVVNSRLHENIKTSASQMASLVQLSNAIGSTADLDTILSLALDTIKRVYDSTCGLIYRVNEEDGTLRCVDSFGYREDILDRIMTPPYPKINECWTISEDQMIAVDDLSETEMGCRTLEKIDHGSSICVALKAEGRALGVMHIRSDKPKAFGEEEQQLALAIADQVAVALQRALLFEEINRLAITDPLTGVFNVRRLEFVLKDEVSRSKRYGRPVSFLMVDVDNLKSYNDNLGHQMGDEALVTIASIMNKYTRDVDKVFRYGGDEFCVILPETDTPEAKVVAEKICFSVEEFSFPGEKNVPGGKLTISVGLATFPSDADNEAGLIHEADLALYTAKQRGRNSVASAV
ncbi:MAG: sensor domain-containing diguanylate cyclase [Actinobacteria bacterium]|nr:sensor domain-containing diguanylate cyclase [Actinomycetota bacterium]